MQGTTVEFLILDLVGWGSRSDPFRTSNKAAKGERRNESQRQNQGLENQEKLKGRKKGKWEEVLGNFGTWEGMLQKSFYILGRGVGK